MNQTEGRDTSLYGHCPTCGQPATTYGFTCGHGTPAPQAEPVELPPLTKPISKSKHWDKGVDWPLAGERAARLEREDQLLAALTDLDQARSELNKAWQKMDRLHNALDAKAAQVVEAEMRLAAIISTGMREITDEDRAWADAKIGELAAKEKVEAGDGGRFEG